MDQELKKIVARSHLVNDTSDIVVDRNQLWIRRALKKLKRELRELELQEILEKMREPK